LQNKIAEVVVQQQQQQHQKPASVPVPSPDHDSEIDFATLFARTIGDKERLQSENALLLAENSRLKNRVEELEVASMLHVAVSLRLNTGRIDTVFALNPEQMLK
jgi:hypothetical protein